MSTHPKDCINNSCTNILYVKKSELHLDKLCEQCQNPEEEKEYYIEAMVTTPQYLRVKARTRREAIAYAKTYDGPDWEIGDEEPRHLVSIS